jgi:hypothetical protein
VGISCHDPSTGDALLLNAFDLDPAAAARMRNLGINSSQATEYFWRRITEDVMTSPKLQAKTLQVWYCPECHTGDPPLTQMPRETIADVWGSIDIVATACTHGYRSVMSMHSPPNSSIGELGSGWYLPPYNGREGGAIGSLSGPDGGTWPGTWLRDLDAELEHRGCDQKGRDELVLGAR